MPDPHARPDAASLRPCPIDHEEDWKCADSSPPSIRARVAVNLLVYHAWKSGQTDWTFSPAGADLDFQRLREDPPCQACATVTALPARLPTLWPEIRLRFCQMFGRGPGKPRPVDTPFQGCLEWVLDGKPFFINVDYAPDAIGLHLRREPSAPSPV